MTTDLFQLTDHTQSDNTITCRITYAPDHEIFKGHFPDNPIVPGVCTIGMVKSVLEKSLKKDLILKESGSVKFLGLITPTMSPTLNISWKETEEGHLQATATLTEASTNLFKMAALYQQKV